MENGEPINRGSPASISSSNIGGGYAPNEVRPRPGGRASATASPPLMFKSWSASEVCIVLNIATTYLSLISAQSSTDSFNISATKYNCSSNLICLGTAHVLNFSMSNEKLRMGRLSLTEDAGNEAPDPPAIGIAYYNRPIRLLDLSTNRSASFRTSFVIDAIYSGYSPKGQEQGDGMTFLMSADNSTVGGGGGNLGIFSYGSTTFKSIVVEFDTFRNQDAYINDMSDYHVSFDFMNIATMLAVNNSDVLSWGTRPLYAWVDYSSETQVLELRTSPENSKPPSSTLNHTVNLFDVAEEYMWVGFSSATGNSWSNYYIGEWTFETDWNSSAPSNSHGSNMSPGIIVVISLASVVAVAACIFIAVSGRKVYRGRGDVDSLTMIQIEGMPERFSYKQLSAATRRFSENSKLGQGGFGSVYGGLLPGSGIPVAVKRISRDSSQGEPEFMTEVSIISRLRHRNLIQLLGWCKHSGSWWKDSPKRNYLLVYELMPNGSLDKALFDCPGEPQTASSLSWEQRLNILTGTAAALDYLHQGWAQQVIHRDIKSSNIMLDAEWNAKLGDFGLARLVDHKKVAATTVVAGTYGYIAPEAATTGRFTEKSDVYAFGAVLLEVACGRRAFDPCLPEDEISLVSWVWHSLSERDLMSTVDKRLEDYDAHWMRVVLTLGLLCSHSDPLARPTMRHVCEVLAGNARVPPIPAFQPAPVLWSFNSIVSMNVDTMIVDSQIMKSSHSSTESSSDGSIPLVSPVERDLEIRVIQSPGEWGSTRFRSSRLSSPIVS